MRENSLIKINLFYCAFNIVMHAAPYKLAIVINNLNLLPTV